MAHNVGDASAKTFADLLSGPIVDIYVGDTKRHWPLHRNLLAYHSDYLKAELQFSPNDTPRKRGLPDNLRLDLPDDDPIGFELLVKWLYQGKIEEVSNILDHNDKYEYAVACQKLHQLCERLEFPRLKNIAMDQYRKALNQAGLVPDAEELNVIYRQSVEESPFRKLMSHIAARQIMDPESDKDAESYRQCFEDNPDFAVDLVNAIKKGMGGLLFEDPTEKRGCEYHDHVEGPNCHIRGKKKLGSSTPNARRAPTKTSHSPHQKPSRAQTSPPDKQFHPLLQIRDQKTGNLRHRRRTSTASLSHTTDIGSATNGTRTTRKRDEKSPSPVTETTERGDEAKTKTTSAPPSPRLGQEQPHREADGAPLEEGSSTLRSQDEERRANSQDGASVTQTNGIQRPKTSRSLSKKLVKRQRSKEVPSVQFEKSINPLWGWTRLGSGRSVGSTAASNASTERPSTASA